MKYFVAIIAFGFSLFSIAQEYQAHIDAGVKAYVSEDYVEAENHFQKVIDLTNDQYFAWAGRGFSRLMQGNAASSQNDFVNAYWIENGEAVSLHGLAFSTLVLRKDQRKAEELMRLAVRLWKAESDLNDFVDDCANIEKVYGSGLTDELEKYAKGQFEQMGRGAATAKLNTDFFSTLESFQSGEIKESIEKFDEIIEGMLKFDPPLEDNYVEVCNALSYYMETVGEWDKALEYAEKGYNLIQEKRLNSPYYETLLLIKMCNQYNFFGQSEKVLALTSKRKFMTDLNPGLYNRGDLMNVRLQAFGNKYVNTMQLSQKQDYYEEANSLLALSESLKISPDYYACMANIELMKMHLGTTNYSHRKQGMVYGERAKELALKNGYESKLNIIAGNLAIAYFQDGQHDKAKSISIEIAKKEQELGDWRNANITLTNLGAMYLFDNQLQQAIPPLQEAVSIVESQRASIPLSKRMDFMNLESSSYSFLNQALARAGKSEELYKSLERSRGRVLAERINSGGLNIPELSWVQESLNPGEAVLMFSVTEPGAVAICVITKEQVKSTYHHDPQFIDDLKRHFAQAYQIALNLDKDRSGLFNPFEAEGLGEIGEVTSVLRHLLQDGKSTMGVQANVKTDLLKSFYQYLIKPIEPYLSGVNSLIICPDNFLGFIPFEALVNYKGQYLIQSYNVKYVPSLSVYKAVLNRNYSKSRKNMIAFGGATYSPYQSSANLARDRYSFQNLLLDVEKTIERNRSQRNNYAALGVTGKSWSYLPGTLTEVNKIAEIVEGVEIFRNADFSEKKIKGYSRSGQLKNYQVVHLATHGMVVPTIPELSTVVTTLNANEADGEDGYLNQVELAQLELNADFVALSACETGLGKVYAGEGISGLMQSLFVAGANGMSVSLWAVSDQGTMYFMTGLYDLVFNKGYSYADGMNEMKRRFIRGDYGATFQHPNYWAPYVYYGK
jgi:CHAT domain-containing protein/tetratricopeptide (TPR) repeat protein